MQAEPRSFQPSLQRILRIAPAAKSAAYTQLLDTVSPADLTYWLEIVFAAGIATFGLVLNSPAVIIGAMLISPLMEPILAAGLALAIGDLYLGIRALAKLAASVALAVALAAGLVWLLPFHSPTAEILGRTNPNLLDLGVAILSGLAGSLVVGRAAAGAATALPGVAIAVALMPPLCTVGFGLGSGGNTGIVAGAALLFLTNLVAIVAAAFLVFLAIGMDAREARADIDRSRREHAENDRVYRAIRGAALERALAAGGRLHWRILMIAVLLGGIFVPLRNALEQVKEDVTARSAVQNAMGNLAPAGALVSHRVSFEPRSIQIDVISTQNIDSARVEQARQELAARTGKEIRIEVQEVASKRDLRTVLERMTAARAESPPPLPPDVASLGRQAAALAGEEIRKIWPAELPLVGYEVAFAGEQTVLRITYEAARDIQPEAAAVLESVLRTALRAREMKLELRRQRPRRR